MPRHQKQRLAERRRCRRCRRRRRSGPQVHYCCCCYSCRCCCAYWLDGAKTQRWAGHDKYAVMFVGRVACAHTAAQTRRCINISGKSRRRMKTNTSHRRWCEGCHQRKHRSTPPSARRIAVSTAGSKARARVVRFHETQLRLVTHTQQLAKSAKAGTQRTKATKPRRHGRKEGRKQDDTTHHQHKQFQKAPTASS